MSNINDTLLTLITHYSFAHILKTTVATKGSHEPSQLSDTLEGLHSGGFSLALVNIHFDVIYIDM